VLERIGDRPRVVIAGYTNLYAAAIRLLIDDGSGFRVAADDQGEDLSGWHCEIEPVDVDADGRSEAHVSFTQNNTSRDWVFAWSDQQLYNLTPVRRGYTGLLDTELTNAYFVDTDGDRFLEIFSLIPGKIDNAPMAPEIYRFSGGRYVHDRPVVTAVAFMRTDSTPATETQTFRLPHGARGPFRFRIFNGTEAGTRVENAVESGRVWLNGQELARPNDFGNQVSVIERSVALQAENEIQVRLAGRPGGRISIVVDPASWAP
jgi:hypothetical protein